MSPITKENLSSDYITEINKGDFDVETKQRFLKRIEEGNFSLSENPKHHFTASFAAYDPKKKLVFVGLHKRSKLWMFNGGHVEENELLTDTLKREMKEEWGHDSFFKDSQKPSFLTITPVISPGNRKCELHYGIWYFFSVDSDTFNITPKVLKEEYIEAGWKTPDEARKLIIVPNYLLVLDEIIKN